MQVLERLQPLDVLFAILWAATVGWGLQAGVLRQVGMLVGVYAAAAVAGTLYRQAAQGLALAFGREQLPQLEFFAYAALFLIVLGIVGLLIWRAYPVSRFGRTFGSDNIGGAAIAAIWGVLFLIALLTILRFYAAVPWRGQETTQQSVLRQVQQSQVAPVLQVVAAPLWQIMTPWFPAQVTAHL